MLLVKCVAKDSGRNCLFFYPKEYIEEADRRGIADKDAAMKKGKRFMTFFCQVMEDGFGQSESGNPHVSGAFFCGSRHCRRHWQDHLKEK